MLKEVFVKVFFFVIIIYLVSKTKCITNNPWHQFSCGDCGYSLCIITNMLNYKVVLNSLFLVASIFLVKCP